ncbi:MAG TPA: carbohydrate-binding protein [Vicinamibacterales bacterium]|nr:carbohydrate-binding protein [Vicinamibacterales bacterium]
MLRVGAGGDLQAAIDAARPGDVILLEAGATFVGNFVLPAKPGSSPITIRTAADLSQLPGPGTRIGPADAPRLPKLRSPNAEPALRTAPGAHHWRLELLEFLPNADGFYDILRLGDGSETDPARVPYEIVVDRCYIHGDPLKGQRRGIALNSARTSIVNSYIADIKAVDFDSQAIAGWNGPGPYLIENNYLEAAGENVLFGGGDPAIVGLVPADITVRRNHLAKPLAWRQPVVEPPGGVSAAAFSSGGSLPAGVYGYRVVAVRRVAEWSLAWSVPSAEVRATVGSAGGRVAISWNPVAGASEYRVYGRTPGAPARYWSVTGTSFVDTGTGGTSGTPPAEATAWAVKNLLELKNARRVLIENNLLEYNWTSAQNGRAILFTPRNQDGGAPWTVVEDILFQYNTVRHIAGAFNILGYDTEHESRQTRNITIRQNLVYDLSGSGWGGDGVFLVVGNAAENVVIEHNTIVHDGTVVLAYGSPMAGFRFTDNLARHNAYGILGDSHGIGNDTLATYFPGAVVAGNVLAGGDASSYPSGNYFPPEAEFLGLFVDPAAGDYRLMPGSPYATAATDGQAVGADVAAFSAATGSGAPSGAAVPFTGTPLGLPGTIQAEDFDAGPAGVAYADNTPGNAGGVYRSTDVDLASAADAGGGYTLGWVGAGEWLRYTVSVSATGTYDLEIRVASAGTGGTFHIDIDGIDRTGPIAVPDTGGWQAWRTIRRPGIALSAGPQVWRVVMDRAGASGAVGNINWIRVTPSTPGSPRNLRLVR